MMGRLVNQMNWFTNWQLTWIDKEGFHKAKSDFRNWKDSRNKHQLTRYFNYVPFGIYYTSRLFGSRVECFHEVLVTVSSKSEVKAVIIKNLDVTSIGCGPGPEIAAYVAFMRGQCNVQNRLTFLAVDKIDYWREFINATRQSVRNVFIRFDNAKINISYLKRINPGGVCIMSYPESVNFGDIWPAMKRYFQLIILVDQSKYQLHSKLSDANFTIIPFQYKGSKHCAYYVAPVPVAQHRKNMSIPSFQVIELVNDSSKDVTIDPSKKIVSSTKCPEHTTISINNNYSNTPNIYNNTTIPINNNYFNTPSISNNTALPINNTFFNKPCITNNNTIPINNNCSILHSFFASTTVPINFNFADKTSIFNNNTIPINNNYFNTPSISNNTALPINNNYFNKPCITNNNTIPINNNCSILPSFFDSTTVPINFNFADKPSISDNNTIQINNNYSNTPSTSNNTTTPINYNNYNTPSCTFKTIKPITNKFSKRLRSSDFYSVPRIINMSILLGSCNNTAIPQNNLTNRLRCSNFKNTPRIINLSTRLDSSDNPQNPNNNLKTRLRSSDCYTIPKNTKLHPLLRSSRYATKSINNTSSCHNLC